MMPIKHLTTYEATVRLRRGEDWEVKPEAEALDGKRVRVYAGWIIEPEDSSLYVGEWAMCEIPTLGGALGTGG